MSCQQASRFITNNNSSSKNNINNNNIKQHINNQNNNNTGSNNADTKGNRLLKGEEFQQEDPYVFTESVPTTPPILFNTQKTRTRLNDLTATNKALSLEKLQQPQKQQKLPLTETNGKITTNILRTQASLSSLSSTTIISSSLSSLSSTTSTITHSSTTNSITTNNKNGVTQSLTTITTAANKSNSKKVTNVCIVRPQLQQQQPHQLLKQQKQHFIDKEVLKSISPPPLYTPPTPSLWHTPLLLETAKSPTTQKTTPKTTITNAPIPQVGNVVAREQQPSNPSPIMGCVSPTVIQTVGSSTTSTTNSPLSTTAMAKVAPIVVHTSPPLAPPPPPLPKQCLPPSKFHNHTLAQHLQKVECLKKSKKIELTEKMSACYENFKSATPTPTTPVKESCNTEIASSLNTIAEGAINVSETLKHSENEELNEIPVNVIFRRAVGTQQQPQENENCIQNLQFVKPAPSTQQQQRDKEQQAQLTSTPPIPSSVSLNSTTPSLQLKSATHVNRKLSTIPASNIITTTNQHVKQQNHTSSIKQQQQCNATTSITTALNFDNSKRQPASCKTEPSSQNLLFADKKNETTTNIAVTKFNNEINTSTQISNKVCKFNFPFSSSIASNSINLNYTLPSYSWQMGCSTTKGAVAIVKMTQHNIDLDITQLATATGLPYCLQQFWLDVNNIVLRKSNEKSLDPSINRSLAREERIALYKQQLRRQAVQLLSTRSLQKLPIQIARRRLMCVDRLLRKYQYTEQNKKEKPANAKRCCIDGCDAYTLQMASHCQQHIVYNTAQHVFLPCTAKFSDNTQCKIPVFDITHDLPLCIEHARKRDAYNRLLCEQRPRKIIATNPNIKNDTIPSSFTTSNKTNVEEAKGIKKGNLIKNQQQPNKYILQQLPSNKHCSSSRRPAALVTHQQQKTRKRKITSSSGDTATAGNPLGRPQKRAKKILEKSIVTTTITKVNATSINTIGNTIAHEKQQMPRLTSSSSLKRKSSSTSLESLTSNSQHSTASLSCTSQQPNLYGIVSSPHVSTTSTTTATVTTTSKTSLPPPALAPLSSSGVSGLLGHGLPQHLFSFGHDIKSHQHNYHSHQTPQLLHHPLNVNDKHSFIGKTSAASTPTELKDLISQFALVAGQKSSHNNNEHSTTMSSASCDVNLLNTNSNSNFTSSGMGSTTSLPTADEFLTQDMLSICENSSASSADTGLGGLSDPELMFGGPEDDIPLGDAHLLEEHDLENVLNSLPEDAFKELFTTVHQDESDEIERAIELADKHLKTLQQTIGSELGDFLDFNDDMLMDSGGDLCNETTLTGNSILDNTTLFLDGGSGGVSIGCSGDVNPASATTVQGGGGIVSSVIGTEIRGGLVQT